MTNQFTLIAEDGARGRRKRIAATNKTIPLVNFLYLWSGRHFNPAEADHFRALEHSAPVIWTQ